ncbi:MAG: hypothetical protein QT02_C0009G0022 [archaeon GW2011_AR9]|nr:MAG: hypothetical protein QT02_C0009G0022 [archaeon GW2011_AR9]HIH12432.1 hypothetical protein [Candidatus Woesearchaeota archaeon]
MARDTFYLSMSYGKPSVHHLEPVIERTWNPVRVFGYGIPHIQVFDKPIWNKPLSDETLDTLETTIRRAIERLDQKYDYAVKGRYKIHERRTSIHVDLWMENRMWESILGDFLADAGTPDSFQNISHTHDVNPVLELYGKRLDGFYVKDREQAA